MSAGAVALRLIIAATIGTGVFFASMFIPVLVRGDDQISASTIVTDPPPTSIESLRSADPIVVVATVPPIAVPSSTLPVVATTPPLPVRTQSAPLLELDDIYSPLFAELLAVQAHEMLDSQYE